MLNEDNKKVLVIIDDIFPTKKSSFRYAEFNKYIEHYDNIVVINISKIDIDNDIKDKWKTKNIRVFQTDFNDNNLQKIKDYLKKFNIKIAPIVFLNNILMHNGKILNFLEENNISFSLTLYPGGGFFLDKECFKKLKKVTESKMFYKVIVTQKKVYDVLLENNIVAKDKIEWIYGIFTSEEFLNIDISNHRYYKINKKINLNICFVAYKYSIKGKDKGYDTFIKVAKKLRKKYDDIYFHVVGNFDENDINVDELYERIAFYGPQDITWFNDFYRDKDIILSPTRVSKLSKGSFDGFPTGATTDAMLNGLLAIVTDPLHLNILYNKKEIVILNNDDADEIVKIIEYYKNHPKKKYMISKRGYQKANKIYSFSNQLLPRLGVLREMEKRNEKFL